MNGAIYLTFDDGPDVTWTPRVLDVLAVAGVRATFFLVGKSAQQAPGIVRRICDEGHELGNHTYAHRHPWWLSEQRARREVRDGASAIEDIAGRAVRFFRPPHGRVRACMVDEANALGEAIVLWSMSAVDWGPFASRRQVAARLARAQADDIVLMHDGRSRWNRPDVLLAVLPSFLGQLLDKQLRACAFRATGTIAAGAVAPVR